MTPAASSTGFGPHQSFGSLLMVEPGLPRDEFGDPYQVVTVAERPGAPSRRLLGDEGEPLVRKPRVHGEEADPGDGGYQPAPPLIAEAARRWRAEAPRDS